MLNMTTTTGTKPGTEHHELVRKTEQSLPSQGAYLIYCFMFTNKCYHVIIMTHWPDKIITVDLITSTEDRLDQIRGCELATYQIHLICFTAGFAVARLVCDTKEISYC